MNSYSIDESEKMPKIMSSLGCEGLRFVQTLTDSEQENYKTSGGLL